MKLSLTNIRGATKVIDADWPHTTPPHLVHFKERLFAWKPTPANAIPQYSEIENVYVHIEGEAGAGGSPRGDDPGHREGGEVQGRLDS